MKGFSWRCEESNLDPLTMPSIVMSDARLPCMYYSLCNRLFVATDIYLHNFEISNCLTD